MPGAVEEIIGREVSGRFAVEESTLTVTATVGEILRNDPERVGWLLVNTGSVDLEAAWTRPATGADSIPIQSNGGSLSVNVREDFVLPTHSLLGRVSAGTTTVRRTIIRRVSE